VLKILSAKHLSPHAKSGSIYLLTQIFFELTSTAVFISSVRNVAKANIILDIRVDFLHILGSSVIYSSSFKTQQELYIIYFNIQYLCLPLTLSRIILTTKSCHFTKEHEAVSLRRRETVCFM